MPSIAIVGAGGFSREVAWLLEDINTARERAGREPYALVGHVVTDLGAHHDPRTTPLGDYDWLAAHPVDCLAIGVGTPAARLAIARDLRARFPAVQWPALIHPSLQHQARSCTFGEGSIVCANNVFTVNIELKPFAMVNLSCTIGHEAVIGEGSVLNPTVNISGGVRLGRGVLVGTGAQLLQYIEVGDGATVGAGAVVSKHVAPGDTVVGVPAKPLAKKSA